MLAILERFLAPIGKPMKPLNNSLSRIAKQHKIVSHNSQNIKRKIAGLKPKKSINP